MTSQSTAITQRLLSLMASLKPHQVRAIAARKSQRNIALHYAANDNPTGKPGVRA